MTKTKYKNSFFIVPNFLVLGLFSFDTFLLVVLYSNGLPLNLFKYMIIIGFPILSLCRGALF
jgi:hypothetical protein